MLSADKVEQNPVVIKGVTTEEFKTVKAIATSIEVITLD
jgi:hypothetical protein